MKVNTKKFLLFLIILILISPYILAKSYTLEKANIDIVVNPDASLSVKELITFNFNGPFTFAYRDIEYNNNFFLKQKIKLHIENIKVYEYKNNDLIELKYELSKHKENSMRVKWFYTANNEKKPFLITYTLKNALKVYNDVTEFNW